MTTNPKQLEGNDLVKAVDDMVNYYKSVSDAIAVLIEADPHEWSTQPCQTCTAISSLLGRNFGCVKKARGAGEFRV